MPRSKPGRDHGFLLLYGALAETDDARRTAYLNGEERAVVISAEDYVRLRGEPTGRALVDLMADSPLGDVILEHPKVKGPVRAVTL
jgi:hypothetical protein